jgi:hypothetical protein
VGSCAAALHIRLGEFSAWSNSRKAKPNVRRTDAGEAGEGTCIASQRMYTGGQTVVKYYIADC